MKGWWRRRDAWNWNIFQILDCLNLVEIFLPGQYPFFRAPSDGKLKRIPKDSKSTITGLSGSHSLHITLWHVHEVLHRNHDSTALFLISSTMNFRLNLNSIWVFPKTGVGPQNGWLISWKTLLKWMIWGYHYFWKHPYQFCAILYFTTPFDHIQRPHIYNKKGLSFVHLHAHASLSFHLCHHIFCFDFFLISCFESLIFPARRCQIFFGVRNQLRGWNWWRAAFSPLGFSTKPRCWTIQDEAGMFHGTIASNNRFWEYQSVPGFQGSRPLWDFWPLFFTNLFAHLVNDPDPKWETSRSQVKKVIGDSNRKHYPVIKTELFI